MTLYEKENAYMSNDNPCTMYLKARIDEDNKLHLTTVMRSSDIYYGLPYDVPFFVFVQKCLIRQLAVLYPTLTLGSYTHMANSLHFYEYKRKDLMLAKDKIAIVEENQSAHDNYAGLVMKHMVSAHQILQPDFMELAWHVAKESGCYKKKVGCVLTVGDSIGNEHVLTTGYGDIAEHRSRDLCESFYEHTVCRRDDKEDVWYETGCPSIHAEHRALDNLRKQALYPDFECVTVYVTHGPCDACLKMLDLVGVVNVYYDIPYKTNYSHWPHMIVRQISNPSNREEGKHGVKGLNIQRG